MNRTPEEINNEVAQKIVDLLSQAFGGRSQWGPVDLGNAIYGWHNNNGLRNPEFMIKVISRLEAAYWENWEKGGEEEFFQDALSTFVERGEK